MRQIALSGVVDGDAEGMDPAAAGLQDRLAGVLDAVVPAVAVLVVRAPVDEVAAAAIALVLLFLTGPLRYVPIAALGAILISASLSLLNLKTLGVLYRLDRLELALALLATVGVIWVGALKAILVVVILALLRFVYLSARPRVEVLGEVERLSGFHSIARHPDAKTDRGLLLSRFNAPHFKQQALAAINAAGADMKWLVLDAVPITGLDYTGYAELEELAETLRERGAELMLAGRATAPRSSSTSPGTARGSPPGRSPCPWCSRWA